MATKIDTRVGCSPNKFGERVPEEFLIERGTAVNTPAVSGAIRTDMPNFGAVEDIACDTATSAGTVRRLIACGSLETVEIELAKARLKYNVTSAQCVVDQHRIEAERRATEGRERGTLLCGGPTLVNSGWTGS